ncbi:MAG TPA: hypothetical protein VG937_16430 [Polyangiaceae bacterium]|nr:hypothetical protein [Polyangiaceae bacterium]
MKTPTAVLKKRGLMLRKVLLACAALTFTSGCYKATFYRDPSVIKGEEHEEWSDFYVFGLVGTENFDTEHFCSGADAAVAKTGGNFATGLVSVVTIGIYTPRKVYVTCAARPGPGRVANAEEKERAK